MDVRFVLYSWPVYKPNKILLQYNDTLKITVHLINVIYYHRKKSFENKRRLYYSSHQCEEYGTVLKSVLSKMINNLFDVCHKLSRPQNGLLQIPNY